MGHTIVRWKNPQKIGHGRATCRVAPHLQTGSRLQVSEEKRRGPSRPRRMPSTVVPFGRRPPRNSRLWDASLAFHKRFPLGSRRIERIPDKRLLRAIRFARGRQRRDYKRRDVGCTAISFTIGHLLQQPIAVARRLKQYQRIRSLSESEVSCQAIYSPAAKKLSVIPQSTLGIALARLAALPPLGLSSAVSKAASTACGWNAA